MTESAIERQLAFWRETLTRLPAELDLPRDRARPAVSSYARTCSHTSIGGAAWATI